LYENLSRHESAPRPCPDQPWSGLGAARREAWSASWSGLWPPPPTRGVCGRLRRADFPEGDREFKLTHKVPIPRPGGVQGLITNTYLSATEYDLLASLPAAVLSKTRFSVPPLGVDVFDGSLQGLVLGEAEFATDEEAQSFIAPPECVAEVTNDIRFTGGRLVEASRRDMLGWLTEYGLHPE
jgi:hypothetical protein